MPLEAGQRLGPYEILSRLGAGGMGEVWRAHDTRLRRDVAIKISQQQFNERFSREARAVAALNHPNICTLYDIGPDYLVMELVEGETLQGPMPEDEVMKIAAQIADALEAAHEKGIVHRDLKPANIKITPAGVVKVLDFGLARLALPEESALSNDSPTTLASPTRVGTILGTAAYMAPEQARGKSVDKRADIWAFGVVLYEILTGKKLFEGETVSDVLAAVLRSDPDLNDVPPRFRRLIARCLQRDPKQRPRDIGDWMLLIEEPSAPPVAPPSHRRSSIPIAAAGILAAIAAAVSLIHFTEKPSPPPEVVRFQIHLPENVKLEPSGALTLSPDGRHVAFPAATAEGNRLFVQDFDGGAAREFANTGVSGATPPFFWSPDSASIAFSGVSAVAKIEIASGLVDAICAKPGPVVGGAWNRDGVIIFGSTTTGLWRAPSGGGSPQPQTRLDASRHEVSHQLPMFLPDGRHYLFLAVSSDRTQSGIFARALDDPPEKPSQSIVRTEFSARFVPGNDAKSGWLLYLRAGTLVARQLDLAKLSLTGSAVTIPARVGTAYQTALFSAAPNVLVYRNGGSGGQTRLTWVNGKTGEITGSVGEPGMISMPSLSPDEKRVVYLKESENLLADVWILDVERGASSRITFSGNHTLPIWSPDSAQIFYGSFVNSSWQIMKKKADGSGSEELVLRLPGEAVRPFDVSPNGRFLIFGRSKGQAFGAEDLATLALEPGAVPVPFSATRDFDESEARFSPDGHYVAYDSSETGRQEVYVRTFSPDSGGQPNGKWLVSNAGGHDPSWGADGRKLYWVQSGFIYAASVDTAKVFHAGVPERVYPITGAIGGAAIMTSKGQGLNLRPLGQATTEDSFSVIVNWMSALNPAAAAK